MDEPHVPISQSFYEIKDDPAVEKLSAHEKARRARVLKQLREEKAKLAALREQEAMLNAEPLGRTSPELGKGHTLVSKATVCGAPINGGGFCSYPANECTMHNGIKSTDKDIRENYKQSVVIGHKGKMTESKVNTSGWKGKYGGKRSAVSPVNAMLSLIFEAHGNVEYLRDRINEQERLVVLGRQTREESTALVRLYNEERDRLAKFTTDALRIGLEQRQVKLYEIQAKSIVAVLKRVFDALHLDDSEQEVARVEASEAMRLFALQEADNVRRWRGPFVEGHDAAMLEGPPQFQSWEDGQ